MKNNILNSIADYLRVDYGLDDIEFEEEDFRPNDMPYREFHIIYYINSNGFIVGSVVWLEPSQKIEIADNELESLRCVGEA